MTPIKDDELDVVLDGLAAALGSNDNGKRSWRGYLATMNFYRSSDGRLYAIRRPQIVKTVYISPDEKRPDSEEEARSTWIDLNLEHARDTLPSLQEGVLVPFTSKDGVELFCEFRGMPRHTGERAAPATSADWTELVQEAAAVYRQFSRKLSRAWERYGSLVALPQAR